VASNVSSCSFEYQAGTSTRRGLLKMRLALTGGSETITLFAQTHVVNAP
jgi:MSHA biogenesis protein MshO